MSQIANEMGKARSRLKRLFMSIDYLSSLLLIEMKTAITTAAKTAKAMKRSSSITSMLSAFGMTGLNIKTKGSRLKLPSYGDIG